MVVVEVGEVIAELSEVVAGANAEVLAQVAVHTDEEALLGTAILHIQWTAQPFVDTRRP